VSMPPENGLLSLLVGLGEMMDVAAGE